MTSSKKEVAHLRVKSRERGSAAEAAMVHVPNDNQGFIC